MGNYRFWKRNSAFVRNANGTVNLDQSRRGGRDLALYGGQVRGRIDLSPQSSLTISASDLFFSGTQLISPSSVLRNQVTTSGFDHDSGHCYRSGTNNHHSSDHSPRLPGRRFIPRDDNRVEQTPSIENGTLSSGFNLIDVIGRLDLAKEKRFPVSLLYNFVLNTQTHDVVIAGPGGVNSICQIKKQGTLG